MQTKQKRAQIVAYSVAILGVTPYGELKTDEKGFKVNSGTASGNQPVSSLRSKIEQGNNGQQAKITIMAPGGQSITLLATEAEVCFAQNLKPLSNVNRGKAL